MRLDEIERELKETENTLQQASASFAERKYSDAYALYKKAMPMLTRSFGPDDTRAIACLLSLADTCYELRRYDEAARNYLQALAAKEKRGELKDSEYPSGLFKMAKCFAHVHNTAEAEKYFKRAVLAAKQVLMPGDPMIGTILEAHATFLVTMKRPREAEELREEARINRVHFGSSAAVVDRYLQPLGQSDVPGALPDKHRELELSIPPGSLNFKRPGEQTVPPGSMAFSRPTGNTIPPGSLSNTSGFVRPDLKQPEEKFDPGRDMKILAIAALLVVLVLGYMIYARIAGERPAAVQSSTQVKEHSKPDQNPGESAGSEHQPKTARHGNAAVHPSQHRARSASARSTASQSAKARSSAPASSASRQSGSAKPERSGGSSGWQQLKNMRDFN